MIEPEVISRVVMSKELKEKGKKKFEDMRLEIELCKKQTVANIVEIPCYPTYFYTF